MAPLDPRLLATFVVLAEELHFGRAARRLFLAQPAITQRLQRLERQLGATLFVRTRHDVSLTPAGRAILPYARQAVCAAEAVARAAREATDGDGPTLRLGLSPGVHYLAERALAELAGVRVEALADNTGVIAREVAAGRLDLGFGFATDARPGVRPEPLCDEPAIVAVNRGHPLADRDTVGLRELAGETFALVDPAGGEGYNRAVRALCAAAGFTARVPSRPSGPMAWEAAVRRHGCVGLTTHVSAASSLRGIRTLQLTDEATFRLDLLWPASLSDPPPAAAHLATAARRLAAGDRPA